MLAGLRVLAEENGILAVYGVSRGTHVPGGVVSRRRTCQVEGFGER